VDCSNHKKAKRNNGKLVLLNPTLSHGEGKVMGREGCLSIPEFTANVNRFEQITVTAQGVDGEDLEIRSEGFEARVIQHEIDHLDGILFLDRVVSLQHDIFRRKR
jgi:peptide deformylase